MARTAPDAAEAKSRILEAAIRVLRTEPGATATIDRVAQEAGCAKGLVHYHYRTKDGLFAEAAIRLWSLRADHWRQALSGPDPRSVIDQAWRLLQSEAADGRLAAAAFLGQPGSSVAGRSVKAGRSTLTHAIADGLVHLFEHMGRVATVPPSEIATLVASLIDGLGWRLATGEAPEQVEPAWAAFWAAILSLTRPA
jgi:AcrR family transcriptional regulator